MITNREKYLMMIAINLNKYKIIDDPSDLNKWLSRIVHEDEEEGVEIFLHDKLDHDAEAYSVKMGNEQCRKIKSQQAGWVR